MMESRWQDIEEDFFQYYKDDIPEIDESTFDFLQRINFFNESGQISEIGSNYLDAKYIFESGEHNLILRREVLNLKEIRELCQSFYGQQTKRENVERFFKTKTKINDTTEAGRILQLLNDVDIVDYSKRKGTVQFKETDQVEEKDQESYRTTRRTPYSNLMRFRKVLRECAGDLLWVDGYFRKKGLEPLAEEVTGDKFSSVRILSGPANIENHVRDDFERFGKEMDNRGITADMRVITDEDKLRDLHDRWIFSTEGESWNVPPITSIYGSQEAEMFKTEKNDEFEDWWEDSPDIIDDWNEIQKFI